MAKSNETKKTVVVNSGTAETQAQNILYKIERERLDEAEQAAYQQQVEQEKKTNAEKEFLAFQKAGKSLESERDVKSITAQTLPATLLSDIVIIANNLGTHWKYFLNNQFTLPAQIRGVISSGISSLTYKVKNSLIRSLSDGSPLALPSIKHYAGLKNDGTLKNDPFPHESAPGFSDEDRKYLNAQINTVCTSWLKEKGYEFNRQKKGFYQGDVQLTQARFAELAHDSANGLDAYLERECKVHFELIDPQPAPTPPVVAGGGAAPGGHP